MLCRCLEELLQGSMVPTNLTQDRGTADIQLICMVGVLYFEMGAHTEGLRRVEKHFQLRLTRAVKLKLDHTYSIGHLNISEPS